MMQLKNQRQNLLMLGLVILFRSIYCHIFRKSLNSRMTIKINALRGKKEKNFIVCGYSGGVIEPWVFDTVTSPRKRSWLKLKVMRWAPHYAPPLHPLIRSRCVRSACASVLVGGILNEPRGKGVSSAWAPRRRDFSNLLAFQNYQHQL